MMNRCLLLLLTVLASGCSIGPSVRLQPADIPLVLVTQSAGYNCLGEHCPYPSQILAIVWEDGRIVRTNSAKGSGTYFHRGALTTEQMTEIRRWITQSNLAEKSPEFVWHEHQPERRVTVWADGARYEFLEFFLDAPDPTLEELIALLAQFHLEDRESIYPGLEIPEEWFPPPAPN